MPRWFRLPLAEWSPLLISRRETQSANWQNIMLTRWLHVLKPLACLSVPCFLTKDLIKSFGNFWMTWAKSVILATKEGSFVCNHQGTFFYIVENYLLHFYLGHYWRKWEKATILSTLPVVKSEQKPPTSGSYQWAVTMLRILQKSKALRSCLPTKRTGRPRTSPIMLLPCHEIAEARRLPPPHI